ncbi:FAD-binding protein [Sphaerimonospora cavernae]|uniref:FAD-binding protein n=1 Tax=Sphaerimonospora cavernae TaxID=1740611 RepID=A0ABV6U301_9ACTN
MAARRAVTGPSWRLGPTGLVTASAGVSLHDLVPKGWFVPVTPGTRYVTVGGAVAADVHGKNHHVDSSFGAHVRSLRLLTADGMIQELTPGDELFWATVGGMGLTGVILEATFRCVPVETSRMVVDVERTRDLDQTLETMAETDHRYRYTVAWIDLLAGGRRMGRVCPPAVTTPRRRTCPLGCAATGSPSARAPASPRHRGRPAGCSTVRPSGRSTPPGTARRRPPSANG